MQTTALHKWRVWGKGAICFLSIIAIVLVSLATHEAHAGPILGWIFGHGTGPGCRVDGGPPTDDIGGHWYWLRSQDEEKRVVAALYNRYCIRCHGVDGRGVWDIPGIPDFTSVRWQACRSDAQRARIILEGRGAVMPPFRGAITLEEAWALGRYLRTFVPGTEESRPDLGNDKEKNKVKDKEKGGGESSQPKNSGEGQVLQEQGPIPLSIPPSP